MLHASMPRDMDLPDLLNKGSAAVLPPPKKPLGGVRDVHRGGSGQLSVQAQSIMVSLYQTFQNDYQRILPILGWSSSMRLQGFISRICGLKRTTGSTRLGILKRRDFVPKRPQNCGGRKLKRKFEGAAAGPCPYLPNLLPAAAPSSLLPDLFHSDADDGPDERPAESAVLLNGAPELPTHENTEGCSLPVAGPSLGAAGIQEGLSKLAAKKCAYGGLQSVPAEIRELVVGLRLGSLALKIETTPQAPAKSYETWVEWIDAQFPGELGQLGHGRDFVPEFCRLALEVHEIQQAMVLQERLPALHKPSDVACSVDSLTTNLGHTMVTHCSYYFDARGCLAWFVPDISGFGNKHDTMAYCHSWLSAMGRYGWTDLDNRLRYAGSPTDGALSGPFCSKPFGASLATLSNFPNAEGYPADNLDTLHAGEKAGQHADKREREHDGFVCQYFQATRDFRRRFGMGKGRAVCITLASKLKLFHYAPLAPVTETTRMITFEHNIVLNLFRNLRLATACYSHSVREVIANVREKAGPGCGPSVGYFVKDARVLRQEARNMLSPSMLLFMTLRAEHRSSGLYIVLKHGQTHHNSAMDSEPMIEEMVHKMALFRVVATAFCGMTYFCRTLFECLEDSPPKPKQPCGIPRAARPSRDQMRAFVTVLLWHAAGRYGFARSCHYFLEIMFDHTFLGLDCGLGRSAHPFNEPVALEKQADSHRAPRGAGIACSFAALKSSTERFSEWSRRESLYFRTRVAFWCSSHPMEDLVGTVQKNVGRAAQDVVPELAEILAGIRDQDTELPEDAELDNPLAPTLERVPVVATTSAGYAGQAGDAALHADTLPHVGGGDENPHQEPCTDPRHVGKGKRCVPQCSIILFKSSQNGRVCCSSAAAYHQLRQSTLCYGGQCGPIRGRWYRVARRKQVACLAARFFSSDALLSSSPVRHEDLKSAMEVLRKVFGHLLWGLPAGISRWSDPPKEMFQAVTPQDLAFQWERLRCLVQAVHSQSETFADFEASDPVPNALLLGAVLQVKYAQVQGRNVWHILALWHRLALSTLRSSMLNEHIGSVLRKMERQDGSPLCTATLIRASRLRIAGYRGSILESAFILQVLRKAIAGRKNIKRFHFFVSDRAMKSKKRIERFKFGPSAVVSRLRSGGIPPALTHPTAPLFPWIYEGWTVRKTRDYVRTLDFKSMRRSAVLPPNHYDPETFDDREFAAILPTLRLLGIEPETGT
jgi:hypothetical protein